MSPALLIISTFEVMPTPLPPLPNTSAVAPGKKKKQRAVDTSTKDNNGKSKKTTLTIYDKVKILDHMRAHGLSNKQTHQYWEENGYRGRVSEKNVSVWKKDEEKIRAAYAQGGAKLAGRRVREVKYPELEAALKLWMEGCEAQLQPISGKLIVTKAERLRGALGLPKEALKFSNSWLDEFKKRHSLKQHNHHGEAGSVNLTSVKEERERIQKALNGWDLNNVFNADETSFFWKSIQNNGLSTKGLPGKKIDKTRMSVLTMMNATGTEKIRLLFIATARKPRCFGRKEGRDLGFWYFYNKKAWMTGDVFADALEELNTRMKQENRRILLLLDNFSGHKWRENNITNITMLFFSPNLTSFVQPADAGIICCLKAIF